MATRQASSPDNGRVFEGRLLRANEFVNVSLLTDDDGNESSATQSQAISDHAVDSNASEKTERISEADSVKQAPPPPDNQETHGE